MYLNKFEFINGAHGIKAAAQIYFGKEQGDLEVQEAATLVGMLKNPSRYNPVRFTTQAEDRRNTQGLPKASIYRQNDQVHKSKETSQSKTTTHSESMTANDTSGLGLGGLGGTGPAGLNSTSVTKADFRALVSALRDENLDTVRR